jgi:hypothetical protein
MNSDSLYPIGKSQQAALGGLIFPPQKLLCEKTPVTKQPTLPDAPSDPGVSFGDCPNGGIGE